MDTQEQVPKTHSPLPWNITNERHGWVTIEDANGNEIINPESNDGLDDPTHFPDLANARLVVTAVNERAELIAALRNLSNMTLLIMPPPYGHECGWCGGCVKRAKSEARALLDKVNKQ